MDYIELSFEQIRATVLTRLKTLRLDLEFTPGKSGIYVTMCKSYEDRNKALMELYSEMYAPVKVSDTEFIPKAEGDMTDSLLRFSEGFDKFVSKLEQEYEELSRRRREAVDLFTKIVSLKKESMLILYYVYYLKYSITDTMTELNISRPTYFRHRAKALEELTTLYLEEAEKEENDK